MLGITIELVGDLLMPKLRIMERNNFHEHAISDVNCSTSQNRY